MYGVTLQGHSDDSCWSRGHSWGVYGFPIAYTYDKSDFIKEVHHDITYFMLNHLPDDMIPYWDYDFTSGDEEPRDASAGAIAVCGLLEMARMLDDSDPDKTIFRSAAAQMLEAIIDKCTDLDERDDGLINHVTAALPQRSGIDQVAVYGDYFYLEALARFKNPDFKMTW
jgi:unsaturated chondroitin disaccharide hydrolase